MPRLLTQTNSVINNFLAEMRSESLQGDPMRFRRNMERIGECAALELSRELPYEQQHVVTPLGELDMPVVREQELVIASVLRAGLPLHKGVLNMFDRASSGFISAYRKYDDGNKFHIELEYISSATVEGKTLILCDAMLATGASLVMAYHEICRRYGKPRHTHIVCAIAARDGLEYLERALGEKDVTLWLAAVDDAMTAKAYVVPGLGDAGDLAYGEK